ncbi:MAG: DUF1540 domain-containing protein [Clostridia bacterium]|nr:DUF1540 domain-containing protein [Clostridia bacterium]
MDKCSPNKSIRCSVSKCKNHCITQNFCSLPNVSIGTHEKNPTKCQCIDCESFKVRDEY